MCMHHSPESSIENTLYKIIPSLYQARDRILVLMDGEFFLPIDGIGSLGHCQI